MSYQHIRQALRTVYNSEDGLSEDIAIQLYVRYVQGANHVDELKNELRDAFGNPSLSWKEMLSNEDYEVYDALSEEDAANHAKKILWLPLLKAGLLTP